MDPPWSVRNWENRDSQHLLNVDATCQEKTLEKLQSSNKRHGCPEMSIAIAHLSSPWGALVAQASDVGITRIQLRLDGSLTSAATLDSGRAMGYLRQLEEQLREYLAGRRRTFDLPLDLPGTEFQMRVWQGLRRIPYGETMSYRDVALAIGQPQAVRAVGQANRRNPVMILVPCHRVIAADGTLGGYAWGKNVKRDLLALEQGEKRFERYRAEPAGG